MKNVIELFHKHVVHSQPDILKIKNDHQVQLKRFFSTNVLKIQFSTP